MARDHRKILGEAGRELHTHSVHVRRAHNKGFIARHEMRDAQGMPPGDGQSPEREYVLPNKAAMLAHMEQHMGDAPEPDEDDAGPAQAQAAPAGAPGDGAGQS